MYELMFVGLGASAFGTLIGVWFSFRLTKDFQQSLLDQQLDFNAKQSEQDNHFRKELHTEQLDSLKNIHEMLNAKLSMAIGASFFSHEKK